MPNDIIDYLKQLESPTPPPAEDKKPVTPFSDLPELMKTIINKDISSEINIDIEQKHRLTPSQGDKMMDIIRQMIFRTITPTELLPTLQRDLKLDLKRATDLTIDLLGRRFIAMEWYLGDAQSIIRRLGGQAEDYLLEAKRNYPEVYEEKKPAGAGPSDHPILDDFEQRISTLAGKAEILLRLTGLSTTVEEAVGNDKLTRSDGEGIIRQLEAMSYAINTKDLNPFEVQSIKRKMKKVISHIEGLKE